MTQKLEDIRKKIDSLDDQIHELLMQRADLIVDISEAKKKGNIPIVQPAREAKMIRRLLARHRGPLPEAAIVKIWRELVGAVSLLQKGLKVSVSTGEGHAFCWDMAKEYFGSVLPMVRTSAPITSISAVREDEVYFAVVPWPQDGESTPWWPFLMNPEHDIRIVAAMPYGIAKDQSSGAQDRALVVSKTDYAPSGEDRTFIAIIIDGDVSRAKIIDVFKEEKLKVLGINTRNKGPGDGMHLVEVEEFVKQDDPRLEKITGKFDGKSLKIFVVGGYPVPPVYKNAEKKPDAAEKKTGTAS
jgi:chorismate mutase/prephenate dehydratase